VQRPGDAVVRQKPQFRLAGGASLDGFQICPQPAHLQYMSEPVDLPVVAMRPDRQNGQAVGAGTSGDGGEFEWPSMTDILTDGLPVHCAVLHSRRPESVDNNLLAF